MLIGGFASYKTSFSSRSCFRDLRLLFYIGDSVVLYFKSHEQENHTICWLVLCLSSTIDEGGDSALDQIFKVAWT